MKNKIAKLDTLRTQIMIALEEIKMLTQKISEEENIIFSQMMSEIAFRNAKYASRLNQKIAELFRL